jgi:3-hydroxyisobutyrate dehydrogenase-like beta-hydroxyacid dehydrogenase
MIPDATVAFLGTGQMGAPMAGRLAAAGYSTRVWNRTAGKAAALREIGVTPCRVPADAVSGAAFVCLCLTDRSALEDVLFGEPAVAAALSAGTIVIDFSTSGVASAQGLAAGVAATSGAAWLDAPVSGGVAGAKAGSLVIFAGGDPAVVQRATPLLQHLAARVTRMGDVGAGQAAKLCNQLIVSTTLIAIGEAIALGQSLGVDVTQLPAALQGGFADSKPLQIFGPRMAPVRDPGPSVGALRTMHKDIAAILAAAADAGVSTPLLRQVERLYQTVIEAGFGDDDLPVLMRLYRDSRGEPNSAVTR